VTDLIISKHWQYRCTEKHFVPFSIKTFLVNFYSILWTSSTCAKGPKFSTSI